MKKINIRESLLNMDRETDCKYDLTSLYESVKLDDEKKKQLCQYIDKVDIDATNRFLSNEASSQGLMENTSDDIADEELNEWVDDEWYGDEESTYEYIASKSVPDADGFYTDYTWYRNVDTDEHVFVFGDTDIYKPEDGDFDHQCDSQEEAQEWFDSYNGLDESLNENQYEDELVKFSYRVYSLDEEGNELDCEDTFDNQEDAIKFAQSLQAAHVVFVPVPDSDEGPEYAEYIEINAPYHDYEIIWASNESLNEAWTDAYEQFNAVVDKHFPDENKIESEVENLYSQHKGEPDWEEAYRRWHEDVIEEDDEVTTVTFTFDPKEWVGGNQNLDDNFGYHEDDLRAVPLQFTPGSDEPVTVELTGSLRYINDFKSKYSNLFESITEEEDLTDWFNDSHYDIIDAGWTEDGEIIVSLNHKVHGLENVANHLSSFIEDNNYHVIDWNVNGNNVFVFEVIHNDDYNNLTNDTDYFRPTNESLSKQTLDEGWFSDDDFEDDMMHTDLYGGDPMYCRTCGSKLDYSDGYGFCPQCNPQDDELEYVGEESIVDPDDLELVSNRFNPDDPGFDEYDLREGVGEVDLIDALDIDTARFYVYDAEDNVVSDEFEWFNDAIDFADENNYPVVKVHRYVRDFSNADWYVGDEDGGRIYHGEDAAYKAFTELSETNEDTIMEPVEGEEGKLQPDGDPVVVYKDGQVIKKTYTSEALDEDLQGDLDKSKESDILTIKSNIEDNLVLDNYMEMGSSNYDDYQIELFRDSDNYGGYPWWYEISKDGNTLTKVCYGDDLSNALYSVAQFIYNIKPEELDEDLQGDLDKRYRPSSINLRYLDKLRSSELVKSLEVVLMYDNEVVELTATDGRVFYLVPSTLSQFDVYDEQENLVATNLFKSEIPDELLATGEPNYTYQVVGGKHAGNYSREEIESLPCFSGQYTTDDGYSKPELINQPILDGYLSPMFNGWRENHTACIRYETQEVYNMLSEDKKDKTYSLATVIEKHKNELPSLDTSSKAIEFLNRIEPEVSDKEYLTKVKKEMVRLKTPYKVLNYLYSIAAKKSYDSNIEKQFSARGRAQLAYESLEKDYWDPLAVQYTHELQNVNIDIADKESAINELINNWGFTSEEAQGLYNRILDYNNEPIQESAKSIKCPVNGLYDGKEDNCFYFKDGQCTLPRDGGNPGEECKEYRDWERDHERKLRMHLLSTNQFEESLTESSDENWAVFATDVETGQEYCAGVYESEDYAYYWAAQDRIADSEFQYGNFKYRVEQVPEYTTELDASRKELDSLKLNNHQVAEEELRSTFDECFTSEQVTEAIAPDGYEPKKKGTAYKVFKVKNGKLYPPMVANPGGADTPVGVWLTADEGEFAGLSKTGRPQVKSTGSGTLSYRPGWHLGDIPRASQFDRTNKETGEKEFPKDFVWAECEYTMDIDYQPESDEQGYMRIGKDGKQYRSDKYQHSLAGLPKLPKDGYYKYRTNPRPDTVPWVITGAIKVNRLLSDAEVNDILVSKGIDPIHRQGGDKTLAELGL